jgi:hypothetical protein
MTPWRLKQIYGDEYQSPVPCNCGLSHSWLNLKHIVNVCQHHTQGIKDRHNSIARTIAEAVRKEQKITANNINLDRKIKIDGAFT